MMSLPLQVNVGRGEAEIAPPEMVSLGMEISLLDWKEMEVMWERVGQRKCERWKDGVLISVEGVEVALERRRSRAVVDLLD